MKLNSITEFHVHSYAIRTGISDASALAELVRHGYDKFMSEWSDAVSAPPPSEDEKIAEKVEGGRTFAIYLPHATIGALQACARAERRSVSGLAKVIIGEGISRRKIGTINTVK